MRTEKSFEDMMAWYASKHGAKEFVEGRYAMFFGPNMIGIYNSRDDGVAAAHRLGLGEPDMKELTSADVELAKSSVGASDCFSVGVEV